MVVTKKQQSHKGENTSLYFLKACQQSYLKQKIIYYDLINIDVGKPSNTLNDFIGQLWWSAKIHLAWLALQILLMTTAIDLEICR